MIPRICTILHNVDAGDCRQSHIRARALGSRTSRADYGNISLRVIVLQLLNRVVAMRMRSALTRLGCPIVLAIALSVAAQSMPAALPGHLPTGDKLSRHLIERVGGPYRHPDAYYDSESDGYIYSEDYEAPSYYRPYSTYYGHHHKDYYPYFRFSRPPGVITLWRPSDPRRGP